MHGDDLDHAKKEFFDSATCTEANIVRLALTTTDLLHLVT